MNYNKSIFIVLALIYGYAKISGSEGLRVYVQRTIRRFGPTNDSFFKMLTRIASPEGAAIELDGAGTLGNYAIEASSFKPDDDLGRLMRDKIQPLAENGIATGCCLLTIKRICTEPENQPTSPRSQKLLKQIKARSLGVGDNIIAIAYTVNGEHDLAFLGGPENSLSSQKFHCPHCNKDFAGSNSKQHIDNCAIFTTLIKLGVLYHLANQTQTNSSSHQK